MNYLSYGEAPDFLTLLNAGHFNEEKKEEELILTDEIPTTIEAWRDEAKRLGILGLSPSEVNRKNVRFYAKFNEWSKSQENDQELREQLFDCEERISDYMYGAESDELIEDYVTSYVTEEQVKVESVPTHKKKRATKYASLQTLEDWKEKAKELGLLGLSPSKVEERLPGFYQSFRHWSRSQGNAQELREQMFVYRRKRTGKYTSLQTMEDWQKKAEEFGLSGLSPTEVQERHPSFYQSFRQWSGSQENARELREQLFVYTGYGQYASLQTIEDWKEKAKELGVLGLSPSKAIEQEGSFCQLFYQWAKNKRDAQELREQMFTYSLQTGDEKKKFIRDSMREITTPAYALRARTHDRTRLLKKIDIPSKLVEYKPYSEWYTLMVEVFPEDDLLQEMYDAIQTPESFASFLKKRKYDRAVRKMLRKDYPTPLPFLGMEMGEVLACLGIIDSTKKIRECRTYLEDILKKIQDVS